MSVLFFFWLDCHQQPLCTTYKQCLYSSRRTHVDVSGQRLQHVKLQVCETDICIITANLSVLLLHIELILNMFFPQLLFSYMASTRWLLSLVGLNVYFSRRLQCLAVLFSLSYSTKYGIWLLETWTALHMRWTQTSEWGKTKANRAKTKHFNCDSTVHKHDFWPHRHTTPSSVTTDKMTTNQMLLCEIGCVP